MQTKIKVSNLDISPIVDSQFIWHLKLFVIQDCNFRTSITV